MDRTKLLVILVNYNGAKLTDECIQSVNESITDMRVDIVVVDNNSDERNIEEVCNKYLNVILIKESSNLGFSYANNRGIDYALENNYDYIMLLNNDTVIDKSMIEILKNECNDYQVAVPCIYYYDKKSMIYYAGGKINEKRGTVIHYEQYKESSDLKPQVCDFATGCCVMMTVNVVRTVGYLKESYFMYCEDTEYSIRLKEKKIDIKFVPQAKMWHKVGATAGQADSPIGIYYGSRNRLLLIKDHPECFYKCAKIYTILTRILYFLIFSLKKNKNARLYLKALFDYRKGITGKVDIFNS